jgi:hypothetical protein
VNSNNTSLAIADALSGDLPGIRYGENDSEQNFDRGGVCLSFPVYPGPKLIGVDTRFS